MDRAIALAKFEFMSNLNIKADIISVFIIATVLFLRVWTVDSIQNKTPIRVGILIKNQNQAELMLVSKSHQIRDLVHSSKESYLKELLKSKKIDAYITQCIDCEELTLNVFSLSEVDAKNFITHIASLLSDHFIPSQFSLSSEEYKQIKSGFKIEYFNELGRDFSNMKVMTTVFMFLVCISVLSAFSLLLQAITMEKEEKITEMYMSTLKVNEWIDGKVLAALGIAVKGLILYFSFAVIALDFTETIKFTQEELLIFITDKALPLFISFSLGFIFWCYMYALISVLIDKSSISIKNAAVLFPMAAFGIIYSISDYVASVYYIIFTFFPLTYIFALPSKIMSSDFNWYYLLAASSVQLISIFWVRKITYRRLKFI